MNLNQEILLPYRNAPQKTGCFKYEEIPGKNTWDILSQVPDTQLGNNRIVTHKYNIFNFIPLNLYDQFSKLANVYFLIIGVLQTIKPISISEGKPVIYMPLTIVLCVSALKDALEDWKKLKSDNEENNKKTILIDDNQQQKTVKWEDLQVGNIVKIYENEMIPADLVLLGTSEQKNDCYIETKNLDGETNLKAKQAPKLIGEREHLNQKLSQSRYIYCEYEKPNPYIYQFSGYLKTDDGQQKSDKISLNASNFVLRGCILKNTKYIYGLVAYTGHQTKIMKNMIKQVPKHSSVEKQMNVCISVIFLLSLFSTSITSLYGTSWMNSKREQLTYFDDVSDDFSFSREFFIGWGTWIMIYTNFVPISLIVSLEFVKFIQAAYISTDKTCHSSKFNISANVQCSALNEELGQVEYIFSDKTGTITSNMMNFKNIIVRGNTWGDAQTMSDSQLKQYFPHVTNVDFRDLEFFECIKQNNQQGKDITDMLIHMAICHEVLVSENSGVRTFQAASTDELAIVNFAKFAGFEYLGLNEQNIMEVKYENRIYKFQLHHVFEFNATRKRQSVVVTSLQDNKHYLYSKGADSFIIERSIRNEIELQQINQHLDHYASKGLRTLLFAKREMNEQEFQQFQVKYQEALVSLENREDKVQSVQEEYEINLEIIGATVVEDQLQDEVSETIKEIAEAGIKFWVLTGDKVETAIDIGYSCELFNRQMEIHVLDKNQQNCIIEVQRISEQIEQNRLKNGHYSKVGLVVSGEALIQLMKNEDSTSKLMKLAEKCSVVMACRVSPKQKQSCVAMVRKAYPKKSTLAIGDGANDVSMITEAQIGIGIQGLEGKQAARASDVSIGEFKFLRNLIFYHGRECYRRNTNLIGYNFYKNILLVIPQWAYGIFNGFSAVTLYDPWLYQLYNMTYTNFPIIFYAIYDREYEQPYLINQPELYKQGMNHELFNPKVFLKWIGIGYWQSLVIGLIPFIMMEERSVNGEGYMLFFASTGMMCYWLSIVQANLRMLQFTNTHSIGSIFVVVMSIISYFVSYGLFSYKFTTEDVYNTFKYQYGGTMFYFVTIMVLGITFGFDYSVYLKNYYDNKCAILGKINKTGFESQKNSVIQSLNNSGNSGDKLQAIEMLQFNQRR